MWTWKKKMALLEARRVERDIRKDIPLRDIKEAHAAFDQQVKQLESIVSKKKKKR
jgi:hypothetical protein